MHCSHRITHIALAVLFLNACVLLPAGAQTTQPTAARAREKQMQNQIFDRLTLLKNLKTKYEFRLRDLTADLRDRAIKLSIDGMGTSGRLSTKEVEVAELTRQILQAQESHAQTKAALDALRKKKDQPDAAIQLKVDKDPRLNDYIRQIDEIDLKLAEGGASSDDAARLQKGKAALEAKAKQRRADLSALLSQAKIESLQNTIDTADQTLADLKPRLTQAKQELGELTVQMLQYLYLTNEVKSTQTFLDELDPKLSGLNQLSQMPSLVQASELRDLDRQILGLPPAPPRP